MDLINYTSKQINLKSLYCFRIDFHFLINLITEKLLTYCFEISHYHCKVNKLLIKSSYFKMENKLSWYVGTNNENEMHNKDSFN